VELVLVRHGLPVRHEVTEGTADPDLDARGHEQARRVAEYLRSETIDAIYSSPMARARQTAAPLAELLGLDPILEPGIAESDRDGKFYAPYEELKASGDPRWRDGMTAAEWSSEHEPLEEFHERVMRAIAGIVESHPGQRVVLFCHSGVICRYTSTILGHPWEEIGFYYPLYTSVSRVLASRDGTRTILSLNEIAHLRGTGLPTGSLH
jgi:2,3-bisphosphoglycerate-dependent phosphoglycerate mutase